MLSHFRLPSFGIVLVTALTLAGTLDATGKIAILDRTQVYFGKPESFKNAGVIEFAKVTAHIPEYKQIKAKGLKKTDAEYIVLAQEGTQHFRKIVKEVAEKKGVDLVAETTAIVPPRGVVLPELTNDAIKKLGGTP
ncbi:MAG: hypothetical protein AB7O52_09330 [Planctomycetota bacterium]